MLVAPACGGGEAPPDAGFRDAGFDGALAVDAGLDAGVPDSGPGPCSTADVVFEERYGGWSVVARGFVDPLRRMMSVPVQLDPSLPAMQAVELGAGTARVVMLGARGDIPRGRTFAVTWSDALNRAVALVAAPEGAGTLVVTVAFDTTTATFEVFPSVGAPPIGPGGWFGPFDALPDGRVVFGTGDGYYLIDLSGTSAIWDLQVPASSPIQPSAPVFDTERSRYIATFEVRWTGTDLAYDPAAQALELLGPLQWTPFSMTGAPPPSTIGTSRRPQVIWDPDSRRVLVRQHTYDEDVPGGVVAHHGLWAADADSATWTTIVTDDAGLRGMPEFAFDRVGRRLVGRPFLDEVRTWSMAPGSEGATEFVPVVGVLGYGGDGAIVADGRIITGGSASFTLDPDAARPQWARLGTAAFPVDYGAARAWDPGRRRILAYGGTTYGPPPTDSSTLYAMDATGASVTTVATTGDAPVDSYDAAAAVVDDQFVLVGGVGVGGVSSPAIYVLDLATNVWRLLAVAAPAYPLLVPQPGGRLWLVAADGTVSDLDPRAGSLTPVTVTGDPPPAADRLPRAPFAGGAIVVAQSTRTLADEIEFWRLGVTDSGACWSSGTAPLDAGPFMLASGVAASPTASYFVDATTWRVSIR